MCEINMKKRCNFGRQSFALPLSFSLCLALLAGCSKDAADSPTNNANPTQATASAAPQLEVVTMADAEVAKAADSIMQQVNLVPAEGLEVTLWAPEKLLADPVAISVDNQGRIWTTITNRSNNSEFDIRGVPQWEMASVTFETVEDRRAFLRSELAPEKSAQNTFIPDRNEDGSHDWRDLAVVKEQVVLLQDTTGNGQANTAQTFLSDFGDEVTDVMGGIYYHNQRDELFVAVGPDAWRVKDTNGDGMADTKASIAHGFNVHIGFSGHGMSGITLGPDGRIYYGIGDVGMSVTDADGKKWHYPNQGVIVRSEPDGSNFEVFAAGVRNTHEFVFDKYGNLVSVDNDGDHVGEYERVVYLIDGSDSGWRINWQLGKYKDPKNNTYKVWMDEEYFKPHFKGQSALILPPIAPYHAGPAGMVYHPGTALNDDWKDHFMVVEFVGSATRSGINAFKLEPKGAGFTMIEDKPVFRGVQGTGLDFGPDGALYMSDWIEGWGRNGKGRIWKLDAPATQGNEARVDTQKHLSADFSQYTPAQLLDLLSHADMRVRLKAQFDLVERGATEELQAALAQEDQLARIHGIWGIGQLARKDAAQTQTLLPLLSDDDAEIRAQAAKLLGDLAYGAATDALIPMLKDQSARVQFFAAQALGRIGATAATPALVAMLEANNEKDVYLRQGGAIALARIGDEAALAALASHKSEAVRVAAVVALGRMKSPALAQFLTDTSEFVATNAARAISDDEFVQPALPALAQMLEQTRFTNEPLLRRAVNANLYEGSSANSARLATFALRKSIAGVLRAEAIQTLGVWGESSIFDRVTGVHRGAVTNNAEDARNALTPIYKQLLADSDAQVREASVLALGDLNLVDTLPTLAQTMRNDKAPAVRIAALNTLKRMGYAEMGDAVFTAMNDSDQSVRMAALGLLPTLELPVKQVVDMHQILLDKGTVGEQQAALTSLVNVNAPEAHAVLATQMQALVDNKVAPEVQLELVTAAEKVATPELQALLASYENSKDKSKPLEVYREALYGGDLESGINLFRYHSSAQCVRCHIVGTRGNLVGPELTSIANTLTHEELLQALVDPAARIAPGFGRITAVMKDGQRIEGFFESETPTTMTVVAADKTHQLTKADVVKTEATASGMPPMGLLLSKAELRDIMAYIATLKGQEEEAEKH
jgi:putative membrane-bound dehydrogenase-like protein